MFMGLNHQEIEMNPAHSEAVLNSADYDFSAKYLAVCHLHGLAGTQPGKIGPETIAGLENVFYNRTVLVQTQSFFLFKEAAGALCCLLLRLPHDARARKAHHGVMNLLNHTSGHAQRATAEALGGLPFSISGPVLKKEGETKSPILGWQAFLEETRLSCEGIPRFKGRSLVVKTAINDRLLVVKPAGERDTPESLLQEATWQYHLKHNGYVFPMRFHIPQIITVGGSLSFRLKTMPIPVPPDTRRHPEGFAIAFLAHPDYFRYPNEVDLKKQLNDEEFRETICRNAFLFGLEPDGRSVDTRHLFYKPLLAEIIQGIFHHYYKGFVGKPFKGAIPIDFSVLAERMVDEMGVDRYMEEMLRIADQQEMTDAIFMEFLLERRVSIEKIRRIKKGAEDITLLTGPHLGGFNQQISIPELIESVGTMAALCIYGRYCEEKLK